MKKAAPANEHNNNGIYKAIKSSLQSTLSLPLSLFSEAGCFFLPQLYTIKYYQNLLFWLQSLCPYSASKSNTKIHTLLSVSLNDSKHISGQMFVLENEVCQHEKYADALSLAILLLWVRQLICLLSRRPKMFLNSVNQKKKKRITLVLIVTSFWVD